MCLWFRKSALKNYVPVFLLLTYLPLLGTSQWSQIFDVASTDVLRGLSFINDSVGYTTIGRFINDEQDFYQSNVIIKTADYAATWDTIYYEVDSCPCLNDSLYSFTDVFFLNESLGWACATNTDRVWMTQNGGVSWQIVDTGLSEMFGLSASQADFENIQFIDENYGVVQNGEEGLHSMESYDGGLTWTVNDNLNGYDIELMSQCDIGAISGGYLRTYSNCEFSSTPFPIALDNLDRSGFCIEYWDNQNIVCGTIGIMNASNFASIAKLNTSDPNVVFVDFFWASITRDVEFLDSQIGYISVQPISTTYQKSILKTLDGGDSWFTQEVEQTSDTYPCMNSLACTSSEIAYGITHHAIFRTVNGGGPLGDEYSGIEDNLSTTENLRLFPNPTNSRVTIELKSGIAMGTLELFNACGELEHNVPFTGRQEIILDNLESGFYIAVITLEDKQYHIRFVKN